VQIMFARHQMIAYFSVGAGRGCFLYTLDGNTPVDPGRMSQSCWPERCTNCTFLTAWISIILSGLIYLALTCFAQPVRAEESKRIEENYFSAHGAFFPAKIVELVIIHFMTMKFLRWSITFRLSKLSSRNSSASMKLKNPILNSTMRTLRKDVFRRYQSQPVGRVVQLINPMLRGLGELLCGRALQRVLQLHQRLGGKEGQAPHGASSEPQGLRLEAME
jgi:hypothetical protein